jgi:hypothetical protein
VPPEAWIGDSGENTYMEIYSGCTHEFTTEPNEAKRYARQCFKCPDMCYTVSQKIPSGIIMWTFSFPD